MARLSQCIWVYSTPADLHSPQTLPCLWPYTENHHQTWNSCWWPVTWMEKELSQAVSVVLFIMGMNLLINAAQRETKRPKTESGIYLPSSRGFMDDLNLTTTTHVQARWMLTALTDVASRGRMKFKAVKSRSLINTSRRDRPRNDSSSLYRMKISHL